MAREPVTLTVGQFIFHLTACFNGLQPYLLPLELKSGLEFRPKTKVFSHHFKNPLPVLQNRSEFDARRTHWPYSSSFYNKKIHFSRDGFLIATASPAHVHSRTSHSEGSSLYPHLQRPDLHPSRSCAERVPRPVSYHASRLTFARQVDQRSLRVWIASIQYFFQH